MAYILIDQPWNYISKSVLVLMVVIVNVERVVEVVDVNEYEEDWSLIGEIDQREGMWNYIQCQMK